LPPKTTFLLRNSRFLVFCISLDFCNTMQINAIKWRSNGGVKLAVLLVWLYSASELSVLWRGISVCSGWTGGRSGINHRFQLPYLCLELTGLAEIQQRSPLGREVHDCIGSSSNLCRYAA